MKFLIQTVFLLGVLSTAFGLSCYFCIGSLDSDCALGNIESMVIEDCDVVGNASSPIGIEIQASSRRTKSECVTIGVIWNGMNMFERACAYSKEHEDVCTVIANTEGVEEVQSCAACSTDLCNI